MPAAEIATGDADARSVHADRIENTLNPHPALDRKTIISDK